MTCRIVTMPIRLELESALAFTHEVAVLPADTSMLMIDFGAWGQGGGFVTPVGMLLVSAAVRAFIAGAPGRIALASKLPDNKVFSYAAHMGFFQSCAIDIGNHPGEATGSDRYLPLTRIDKPALLHGSVIEKTSRTLARKLTQQDDGALVNALTYALTEVMRNVAEHAHADDYWYCAQYWPARGEAEIALIDGGRGLCASLSQNPIIRDQVTDDLAAIKFALMPGISGTTWHGKPQHDDDPWQNSGFGLYMNYRICSEGGSFFIASGNTGVFCERDSEHQWMPYHLAGVALCLRMHTATLEDFDTRYKPQFVAEGERAAKQIAGGITPTGERMSRMLRSGFAMDDLP